MTEPIEMPFG